jgi:hypothetical protein
MHALLGRLPQPFSSGPCGGELIEPTGGGPTGQAQTLTTDEVRSRASATFRACFAREGAGIVRLLAATTFAHFAGFI